MRARRRDRQRDRAAALVEFALVIPLLTLFLFGIVQFGIAYDKQQSINSAAREGARLGALPSTTLQQIGTRSTESYSASAAPQDDPVIYIYGGTLANTVTPVAVRCGESDYRAFTTNPDDNDCGDGNAVEFDEPQEAPCGEGQSAAYAFLRVVAETPYDITIPFFGVQTVTIDSEAEFRCE